MGEEKGEGESIECPLTLTLSRGGERGQDEGEGGL